jgi:membrane fusion protein, multidrug efflux system
MRGLARCTAFLILAGAMAASAVWAQQGTTPLAVLVQPAEMRPIASQREFIGRAQAVDKVDLRARVQGFLGPRKFADGDLVKEGQLLFVIEPEPYQAAVHEPKSVPRRRATPGWQTSSRPRAP